MRPNTEELVEKSNQEKGVQPVRLGVLSTGFIAEKVVASARASTRVDVVAIASRTAVRAQVAATAWGIEQAFGSYDELLASDDIEAVYIALPNALHVEWAMEALRHGKHVLCEKPFDRRPDQLEAIFDFAAAENLLVAEALMYRHHPQTRLMADLVTQGVIGELQAIRAAFSFIIPDPAVNVRLSPELGGGSLMDVGCYCISAARLLAGEPVRVYGEQIRGPSGVDERFHATVSFPKGVVAHIDAGLRSRHAGLAVIGSEGTLILNDPWHCRRPGIEIQRPSGDAEFLFVPVADAYRLELEDLAGAVRRTSLPLLGREDALGQAHVIEALYRSAATGAPVVL